MNEPRAVMVQLPWPTSINAYWKTTSFGSVYVGDEGDSFGPTRLKFADPKGGNPDEWPEDLRVRQMPEVCR